MKTVATIEARMTSTRLPGKVLLPIMGKPSLEWMIDRVRQATRIDEIVVATTINEADLPIVELCHKTGVSFFRGSEEDVLDRVLKAARSVEADLICELTGDCPLIDPELIDRAIEAHLSGEYDYTSTLLNKRTFPLGQEVQVFPTEVLARVDQLTGDPIDRVHVSCFIYQHPELFRLNGITAGPGEDGPDIRITLDTPEDYQLIQKVLEGLVGKSCSFGTSDIVSFFRASPELLRINEHIVQKSIEEG